MTALFHPGMLEVAALVVLTCPACGSNNLHHDRVLVFSRDEDAEATTVTEVTSERTVIATTPSRAANNPSSRRDGLAIKFWCENCSAKPELTIAQHKGETQIGWRDARSSLRCVK
jgi:hypothetical protein